MAVIVLVTTAFVFSIMPYYGVMLWPRSMRSYSVLSMKFSAGGSADIGALPRPPASSALSCIAPVSFSDRWLMKPCGSKVP